MQYQPEEQPDLTQAERELLDAHRRQEFLPEQLEMIEQALTKLLDLPRLKRSQRKPLLDNRKSVRSLIVEIARVTDNLEQQWALPATHER